MTKKAARKHFIEKRDALDESWQLKADDLILIQFQTLELPFLERVMSFYSIPHKKEVNSFLLTDFLHFRNPALQLAYPRMNVADNSMDAVLVAADEAFIENEYGINEPVGDHLLDPHELDLVLVPLLAIDRQGHRVGYGKGYYDRFLARVSDDCLKVGVSYFEPVERITDTDQYDLPLDLCVTPQQVYVF
ncbi:5-formyltetrahydrofolate cyclo-ligase [Flaviaesturariibacter aridisoli]|uniref:5-formyltetrahydrofolate cyclo-ligase n=1 Tax=Flaviaesturariibacter aridisoli TaxID=2545761 RepID=A0A4R4DXF3_9BACT|nr:5-formyltetrahydrofolate cyclo-ligase [Flaviaesturariibacter aridisoli]TCZ69328.1 5-formyltetrahydrofolate cyclo-ligase [Flaviaesturariibacter aridisoli]